MRRPIEGEPDRNGEATMTVTASRATPGGAPRPPEAPSPSQDPTTQAALRRHGPHAASPGPAVPSAAAGLPGAPWARRGPADLVSARGGAAPPRGQAAARAPDPAQAAVRGRGLVMMSDARVLDGVLRLAAAGGCEV